MADYLQLSDEDQKTLVNTISRMQKPVEIQVEDKKYLLAHTVPGIERVLDYKNWSLEKCVLGEPDYEECYFENVYVLTGHTPTGFIEKQSLGRIWIDNNHIAIGCGVVFGKTLGCLCLDNMEEYYVI